MKLIIFTFLFLVRGGFIYLEDKVYQCFINDETDQTKLKKSYYSYTSDVIGNLTNTNFNLGFWMKYSSSTSKQILLQTNVLIITMLSDSFSTYDYPEINFIADHSITLNTGNWLLFSFQQEGTKHSILLTDSQNNQQNISISFRDYPTYFSFFETNITSFIGWLGQAEQMRLITGVNFQSRDYQEFIILSTLELRTLLFIKFQEKVQTQLLKDWSSYDYEVMLGGSYNIRTDVDDPILDLTDQSFKFGSSKFLNISNFALPSSFNIELRFSLSDQSISNFAIFSLIQKAQPQLVIEYVGNGNLKISIDSEQFNVQLEITVPVLTIQLFFIKIYDDLNGSKLYGKFYQINDQGGILKSAENIFTSIDLSMKYAQHLLIGSPFNSIGSEFVKFYEVKVNQGAFFMEDTQMQNCKLFVGQRCVVCDNSYVVNHDGTCQSACPDNYIFSSYHNKCIRKCHNLCESCSDSDPTQCIVCAGNRINPPICECQQGFEDYVSPTCKKYIKDSSVQVGVVEFELSLERCCMNSTQSFFYGYINVFFQQPYKIIPKVITDPIGIFDFSWYFGTYIYKVDLNKFTIYANSDVRGKFLIKWMSGISQNFIDAQENHFSINTIDFVVPTYSSTNSIYLTCTGWELNQKSITTTFITANTATISYHNANIRFRYIRYTIFEYSNYQVLEETAEINFEGDSKYQINFGTSKISTVFDTDFPLSIDFTFFIKNYIMKYLTISQINQDRKLRITRFFHGNPSTNWIEYFTIFLLATQCTEGICDYFQSMIDQCNKKHLNCDRYFFNGSSMVQCDSNCYECSSPGNLCLSCIASEFKELDTSTSTCKCMDGYYMGPDGNCEICNVNCKTCLQSATICISCIDHKFISSSKSCQDCDSNCKTCETSPENCLSCYDFSYLGDNFVCISNPGYYYYQAENVYKPCDSNCQECITTSTKCTSCFSSFYLENNVCLNCSLQCFTCEFSSDNCTSCNSNASLNKIANSSLSQCLCNQGYYMNLNQQCQICDEKCLECVNEATNCTQCNDTLYFDADQLCQYCDQTKCLSCELEPGNCLSCHSNFYLLGNNCVQCHKSCDSCSSPLITDCLTCLENMTMTAEKMCVCSIGYFEIEPIGCDQCQETCKTCKKKTECIDCKEGLNRNLDLNYQCSCELGYYESGESLQCLKCLENCATCTNGQSCASCDSTKNRTLINGFCECKEKFFLNEISRECISCHSFSFAMIEDSCNYKDCSDKVWTKGEECDDGNNTPRDGCSDCIIDPDYKCINELLQPSFCYQCQQNCKVCEYQQRIIKCLQCHEGYYLKDNQCFKCKENCKTCESLEICKSCTYYPLQPKENGKCPYCEDTVGLVTVGNQCLSICGDGIIYQPTEECDDGNTVNDDGCDIYCKREKYFYCEGKSCTRIYPPKPIIISIEPENIEINERNFTLYYDSLLVSGINLANQITIEISDKQENIDYQVLLGIENFLLNINIRLLNSFQSNYLLIHFKSPEQIVGVNGLCQEIEDLSILIQDYYFVTTFSKELEDNITFINNLVLYIFGGLIVLAIIFGGLDAFWNLFDILQILSYLKFIDTNFPFNISSLLNAFEFGNLSFLDNLLYIKDLINLCIDKEELLSYVPRGILADQVENGLFIVNVQSTISALVIVFTLYLFSKIVIYVLPQIMKLIHKRLRRKLLILRRTFKIYKSIFSYFSQYQKNFFWNILIRTHMSTAYDMTAAIVLQFQFGYSEMQSILAKVSYISCCVVCVLQMASFLFYTSKIGITKAEFTTPRFQKQYGASLFDSLDAKQIGSIKTYYNIFLYSKRHIHILLLVLLCSVPQYQSVGIAILGFVHIIFLVFLNPLENRMEYFKQISSEILMYVVNMKIFVLTLDDQISFLQLEGRIILGWILVGEITLILVSHFIIDLYLQGTIFQVIFNKK